MNDILRILLGEARPRQAADESLFLSGRNYLGVRPPMPNIPPVAGLPPVPPQVGPVAGLVTINDNGQIIKLAPGEVYEGGIRIIPGPAPTFTGLLDDYPGAAAAYSLRRLATAYTGPLVQVRRASDNDETTIPYKDDGTLDVGVLNAFAAGTDAFVSELPDQSGNGNDATQTTTSAQPKIYDASTGVVTENGKPAVQFSATTFVQNSAGNIRTQNCAQVLVSKFTQTGTTQRIIDRTNVGTIAEFNEQYNQFYFFDGTQGGLGPVDLNQNLFFYNRRTSDDLIAWHKNSLLAYSTTGYASSNWPVSDGSSGFSYYRISNASLGANMNFQELITWNEDQSSNRTGIETNINDYYSIY